MVQLTPGSELDENAAIEHCRSQLAGYEVPKKVIVMDAIDITSTGKVKKPELRAQFADLFAE